MPEVRVGAKHDVGEDEMYIQQPGNLIKFGSQVCPSIMWAFCNALLIFRRSKRAMSRRPAAMPSLPLPLHPDLVPLLQHLLQNARRNG
jgi:hypothetical protein